MFQSGLAYHSHWINQIRKLADFSVQKFIPHISFLGMGIGGGFGGGVGPFKNLEKVSFRVNAVPVILFGSEMANGYF